MNKNETSQHVVDTLREAMQRLSWEDYKQLIDKLHKTLTEEKDRIK